MLAIEKTIHKGRKRACLDSHFVGHIREKEDRTVGSPIGRIGMPFVICH